MGDATTISYEVEASEQQTQFDRGVVAVKGVLGLIPRMRFLGEPSDGPMTVESLGHQVFVQTELNDAWKLQAGLSYRDSSLHGNSSEAANLLADGRILRRQRRFRDFSGTDSSGRFEVMGKFATGGFGHSVLLGVDAYRFVDTRIQWRRPPNATNGYTIDIYQPVYGAVADPLLLAVNSGPTVSTHKTRWTCPSRLRLYRRHCHEGRQHDPDRQPLSQCAKTGRQFGGHTDFCAVGRHCVAGWGIQLCRRKAGRRGRDHGLHLASLHHGQAGVVLFAEQEAAPVAELRQPVQLV